MISSKDVLSNPDLPRSIRNHYIFLSFSKFEKVFPGLGLSNYAEPIKSSIKNGRYILRHSYDEALDIAFSRQGSLLKDIGRVSITLPTLVFLNLTDGIGIFNFKRKHPNSKVIFSSTGTQGIWDIATMSMRGIQSCQTWGCRQATKLVGSIVDPYCGIIYLTNGNDDKMIYRAVVRYIIHKQLGPALMLERIYPYISDALQQDAIFAIFARSLAEKTKLPIYLASHLERIPSRCYIPTSKTINALMTDRSYRDSGIEYYNFRLSDLKRFKELKQLQQQFGG